MKGKSLTRAQAVALASDTALGRFPGQGSAQNDTFPYNDNVDINSPAYIDYVLPKNFQRILSAKLSLRHRNYRTYNSLTLASTGAQSASHTHASAAHNHGLAPEANTTGAQSVTWDSGNIRLAVSGAGPFPDTSSIQNTTPGATGVQSVGHTHSVSGSAILAVTEAAAPANPGTTIAFDGVDHTAALGGPFNALDVVEIDVTQFLSTAVSIWHTVSLQPNQLVRMIALLRISYYVDSRLAQ